MSFRVVYNSGMLDVFFEEKHIIHQPFQVNDTGLQELWTSEEQAVAWWDSIKAPYEQQYIVNQDTGEE
jgi:hypothetical protein